MEKLSISKLIANDIVNYGMDKTTSFNYIVSLNDFLDDYDYRYRFLCMLNKNNAIITAYFGIA